MANSSTSRNIFKGKCNSKTPVQLSGINDASGTLFFNSSTVSRITELSNINFQYKPPSITKLGVLKNSPIRKNYDIIGAVKWVEETKKTLCGKAKYERQIRHAIIADKKDEECFKLTVWDGLIENTSDGHTYIIKSVLLEDHYGLRLNTTSSTVFDTHSIQYNKEWSKFSIEMEMLRCAALKSSRLKLTHFINLSMRAVSAKSPYFQGKKK